MTQSTKIIILFFILIIGAVVIYFFTRPEGNAKTTTTTSSNSGLASLDLSGLLGSMFGDKNNITSQDNSYVPITPRETAEPRQAVA